MNIPLKPIKTNIQLNTNKTPFLLLNIENQDHNFKDQITITPNGLSNSSKIKNKNENAVYFGCESNFKSVSIILFDNY